MLSDRLISKFGSGSGFILHYICRHVNMTTHQRLMRDRFSESYCTDVLSKRLRADLLMKDIVETGCETITRFSREDILQVRYLVG